MIRSHLVLLSAIAVAAIALIPTQAFAAAPPRVVALAELASKPVEVAITTKHLTLIHFESGDVSMVAVGDPGIVSVTVKGADVLLKALLSSGSTNAFIWQGGRYTQWTFTVRQSNKDARVIIVRDSAATGRDESRKSADGSPKDGKPATGSTAAPPTGQPAIGSTAPISATTSAPSRKPSAGSAPPQPETAGEATRDACAQAANLDHFVKTLNVRQRELFSAFLTEPSLVRLQMLLLELNVQQRCDLLALLSAPAPEEQSATDALGSTPPGSAPVAENDHETNRTSNGTTENCPGSVLKDAASTVAIQEGGLTPAGVVFPITP